MPPKTDTFYFILPDKNHRQVFLSPTNDGWTLPYCEVTVPDEVDLMDTDCFNRAVKEQFGINVTMLYALDTIDAENVIKIAVFENHTPEWEPPDKARWIGHEALGNLTIIRPIMKSVLETWFAEATENYAVEPLMPWSKMAQAHPELAAKTPDGEPAMFGYVEGDRLVPRYQVVTRARLIERTEYERLLQRSGPGIGKLAAGPIPLYFRLSKRMTSSGGKTACHADRSGRRWYEISVSTTILFGCFTGEDHRPITASGITCRDRLDALQRIMEHELVHLIEMLLWDKSSCSQPRFHSITLRFFGHTENKHLLITPREKALVKFGVRPGIAVRFRFDGVEHTGIVNRISKRATVLVENREGQRYSDGKHYLKFYVPVQLLEAVE